MAIGRSGCLRDTRGPKYESLVSETLYGSLTKSVRESAQIDEKYQ